MMHLGPKAQEQDWGLQDHDEEHQEHDHTYQDNYSDDEQAGITLNPYLCYMIFLNLMLIFLDQEFNFD